MRRQEETDKVAGLLRGLLAVTVERERREGVSGDQLAATLARCGLAHAESAIILGTTPDGARVAAVRGRKAAEGRPRSRGSRPGDA